MMMDNGCLGENNEILNSRLQEAFREDRVDIQILSSALGNMNLDERLKDVNMDYTASELALTESHFPEGGMATQGSLAGDLTSN
jgi:hypothetical protein